MCKSRLSLIEQSVKQLNELAKNDVFTDHIYLPFPGIENGMLDKAAVLPLLSKLDNKVIVITLDKIVNIVRC